MNHNAGRILSPTAALSMIGCDKELAPPPAVPTPPPLTVKIGHVAPFTGPQAHLSKDNDGAQRAVDDANAAKPKIGGRDIVFELVKEDDQADPKQGKKPDLVFYGGMDSQAGPMAAQMRKLGLKQKLPMGDGCCTTECHKPVGEAAADHLCALPGVPLAKMPGGPKFIERDKAKFNTDIQLYAPYAYDAALVVIDAMKRADSAEPAKVLAELPKTAPEGIAARIAFDGDVKDDAIALDSQGRQVRAAQNHRRRPGGREQVTSFPERHCARGAAVPAFRQCSKKPERLPN